MSGTQLVVLAAILSALAAIVGIYYLAKQNARENQRQQEKRTSDAVVAAVTPLQAQLTVANQTIFARDRALERAETAKNQAITAKDQVILAKDARIDALEDELRRQR